MRVTTKGKASAKNSRAKTIPSHTALPHAHRPINTPTATHRPLSMRATGRTQQTEGAVRAQIGASSRATGCQPINVDTKT